MKKRQVFYIRTFQCPDCGNKVYASKVKGFTGNGHIKDIYCPYCRDEKQKEQIEMQKCK